MRVTDRQEKPRARRGRPCSVPGFIVLGPRSLQLRDRLPNAEPYLVPLRIPGLGPLVGLHGRENLGVRAAPQAAALNGFLKRRT